MSGAERPDWPARAAWAVVWLYGAYLAAMTVRVWSGNYNPMARWAVTGVLVFWVVHFTRGWLHQRPTKRGDDE